MMAPLQAALLKLLLSPMAAAQSTLELQSVVLLSRHGIRTPYGADNMQGKVMGDFSATKREWFDNVTSGGANLTTWGASIDNGLTQHGAMALRLMGTYYRPELLKLAPGAAASCGELTIYADADKTGRDVDTATAFLAGLLPGCKVPVHAEAEYVNWVFNQGGEQPGPGCTLPSQPIVDGTIGGEISKFIAAQRGAVMAVNDAVGCCQPSLCGGAGCSILNLTAAFDTKAFWSLYSGPLAVASNLAEYVQMMYLNNLETTGLIGSAHPDPSAFVTELMQAHITNLAVTDSSDWTARAFGSDLLAHLSATIEQLLGGASNPSLKSKPNDKMVYYAGHDINIYFVRKLLGLQWLTESYNPNQSPPGGMLRFELLRPSQSSPCATALTAHCAEAAAPASCDLCAGGVQHPLKIANCSSQDIRSYCNEAGHHGAHGGSGGAAAAGIGYVKVFFESQSQDQVRTAAPLSAAPGGQTPDRVFVAIPRCADGPENSCPFTKFKAIVAAAVDPSCINTTRTG